MQSSKNAGIYKAVSKNETRVLNLLRKGFDVKGIAYETDLHVSTIYAVMKRNGFRSVILSPVECDLVFKQRNTDANSH